MSRAWQGGSTRAWRRTRAAVLLRDGYRCQLTLHGCTIRADQVHHTAGRATTGDHPDHLVAACAHCNRTVGDPTTTDPTPTPRTTW